MKAGWKTTATSIRIYCKSSAAGICGKPLMKPPLMPGRNLYNLTDTTFQDGQSEEVTTDLALTMVNPVTDHGVVKPFGREGWLPVDQW
jgi:hypothetical protein